jgi:hypothetical protein
MFMQNTCLCDTSSQHHVTYVVTCYPYTDKPVPAPTGTGLLGWGTGWPENPRVTRGEP